MWKAQRACEFIADAFNSRNKFSDSLLSSLSHLYPTLSARNKYPFNYHFSIAAFYFAIELYDLTALLML